MAKAEWGTKRQCLKCGVKFYDFNRVPIVCPSCGAEFEAEVFLSKLRRNRATPQAVEKVAVKKEKAPEKVEDNDNDADDILEDISDDDLIEDSDDLEDDDIDVAIEKEDDEN